MQIRHRNDWISSLLVYFKNFNNICIVYEYQPFQIVKFTFSLKPINIPKFKSRVNFKHKNASPGKSLNSEAIFFYYFDETDQKTNLRQVSKLKY